MNNEDICSATPGIAGVTPESSLIGEFQQLGKALKEFVTVPDSRIYGIGEQIAESGSYELTGEELRLGAMLAWRNHARCNGRMHWRTLQVLDFRRANTVQDVFEGCLEHLEYSTNNGALRAVISVFPQSSNGMGFEILNPQLIRYAGYRRTDGSVIGDPLHLELTDLALEWGWVPARTAFDVLPLLIKSPSGQISMYEIPPEYIMEVQIEHPEYPGIGELGLRWHVNPAISDKVLSIGGLEFRAAPFSGWYVSSEIGARNLSDESRYNMLPCVARAMGLDTRRDATLWKDRAAVELTYAVQWSYGKAGVHIVDHHTAAKQFIKHVEREHRSLRKVPTDWSWINPPISASTTPTFHRAYDDPDFALRPNFLTRGMQSAPAECPAHG
ncbi:nitric oxide synthase oxygenase [Nocardia ninae]|uniref:nitric oxide synthase oxygenase n=1 Tax=Nocardia ninae TaxID=356145 RepID=UPI0011BFC402|nr:nitric oxide synthase oxygenase [Nocardia ninae]